LYYPNIDPVIFSVGPVSVRWYGMAYLAAFAIAWGLGLWRIHRGQTDMTRDELADLVFYGALGAVLGGRFGYALFYGLDELRHDPAWLLRIWEGGMSFHGGLIGVLIATWIFARLRGRNMLSVADFVAPLAPIGLGIGRLGNFVNVELPGRATDVAWGLIYRCEAVRHINQTCVGQWESFARHPSPLYQAFTDGIVLFAIVWLYARRPREPGAVMAMFLIAYGALRFITENFREPDQHIGFLVGWLTMGQLLSLPMLACKIIICHGCSSDIQASLRFNIVESLNMELVMKRNIQVHIARRETANGA
jgi:phosphatidylglycerol---prolipoprotein diacylglyceryl transferase